MLSHDWEGNMIRKTDPELSFVDAALVLIEKE